MANMTDRIEALRTEAAAAGDFEMVAICERALDGDAYAIEQCRGAIVDALAMQND